MNWFSASRPQPGTECRAAAQPPAVRRERTEAIRLAMLKTLDGARTPEASQLMQRIRYAGDAERLWYLRPETMSVLASLQGEALARKALARISVLFQDVLPEGLASQLRAVGKVTPIASRRLETFQETS